MANERDRAEGERDVDPRAPGSRQPVDLEGRKAEQQDASTDSPLSAGKESVIPGPRSFGGANYASTERQQTEDHTTPRTAAPHDDVQKADRNPPENAEDVKRR